MSYGNMAHIIGDFQNAIPTLGFGTTSPEFPPRLLDLASFHGYDGLSSRTFIVRGDVSDEIGILLAIFQVGFRIDGRLVFYAGLLATTFTFSVEFGLIETEVIFRRIVGSIFVGRSHCSF